MGELVLKDGPTFVDFQEYVRQLEVQRGFTDQNAIEKCLLLGEEMGELFKAVRKAENLKTDINANRFEIDIEEAFREKEEVNKKREWK